MTTANTTARLEARLPADVHMLLKRAAALEGRTLTDFAVSAVRDAARRTIEENEILRLTLEDQCRIAASIINPPAPTQALRRAAADAAQCGMQTPPAVFTLLVDAKNDAAMRFYEHHGFRGPSGTPRTLFLPLAVTAVARRYRCPDRNLASSKRQSTISAASPSVIPAGNFCSKATALAAMSATGWPA